MNTATRTITAFLDGPDSPDISNPIHSTEVATQYGFRAALVGGVTVYGWTVPAIIGALGEGWLERGWADVSRSCLAAGARGRSPRGPAATSGPRVGGRGTSYEMVAPATNPHDVRRKVVRNGRPRPQDV